MPHSPEIFQTITIAVEGESYTAWSFQKGDYEENSESSGRPLKMRCDISQEADVHEINNLYSYFGICTLD